MSSMEETFATELKKNRILLISTKSNEYRSKLVKMLNHSGEIYKKTCCVTVNDPCETIINNMDPASSRNIVFVDCVTQTIKRETPKLNVIYVSSPRALTEISITVKKILERGNVNFVIFNTLSTLLIYEETLTVLKFVHNLVLSFREAGINAAFLILREDVSDEIMKDMCMFVDKIINV